MNLNEAKGLIKTLGGRYEAFNLIGDALEALERGESQKNEILREVEKLKGENEKLKKEQAKLQEECGQLENKRTELSSRIEGLEGVYAQREVEMNQEYNKLEAARTKEFHATLKGYEEATAESDKTFQARVKELEHEIKDLEKKRDRIQKIITEVNVKAETVDG